MEYVDGVNLRQALQAGSIHPQEALAIVPQICEALQFAHDEGVVHRDIKPENILIDKRGRVKIADFGLAKLLGQETAGHGLTATQQVMGTLQYMAPEQMEGAKEVDHRADIFSLGVVFYELLTGELPVGRFAPPSQKVQVDVRLDEVVLRALENEPARRYQHASEVKTAIEQVSVPRPTPPAEPRSVPGEIPPGLLPWLMATALGGLIGGLTMAVGVALACYAILSESPQTGQFWGWMGGAFGCFFGGGGALIGAINGYRQIAGAGDLMTTPGWNWLDRIMTGYAVLGGVSLVTALAWSSLAGAARYALLLLGAIVVVQAAGFWVSRAFHSPRSSVAIARQEPRTIAKRSFVPCPRSCRPLSAMPAKGLDHGTIRTLLLAAGWKERDIAGGIVAEGLEMSVPEPAGKNSARDAFLYLLTFASLYITVWGVIVLCYTYLDYLYPDPAWARPTPKRHWTLSGTPSPRSSWGFRCSSS